MSASELYGDGPMVYVIRRTRRTCRHLWHPVLRPVSLRITETPRESRASSIEKVCIHCGLRDGGEYE